MPAERAGPRDFDAVAPGDGQARSHHLVAQPDDVDAGAIRNRVMIASKKARG
jgi:hypothetical protein